jgi:hypothetical protein
LAAGELVVLGDKAAAAGAIFHSVPGDRVALLGAGLVVGAVEHCDELELDPAQS